MAAKAMAYVWFVTQHTDSYPVLRTAAVVRCR